MKKFKYSYIESVNCLTLQPWHVTTGIIKSYIGKHLYLHDLQRSFQHNVLP